MPRNALHNTVSLPLRALNALRVRVRGSDPHHRAIASGMLWVALFLIIGSLARAAKEVVIAYRYGVSAEVDAYLVVFNLVNWPVSIWFSVLISVLVPLLARSEAARQTDVRQFRSELLGLSCALGVGLMLLSWLGLTPLLTAPWTGLSAETAALAVSMVPAMGLLAPLGVFIGLLSAWLLSAGRHSNTLFEAIPSVAIIAALLAFPFLGIDALVWGTVLGFVLHGASLCLPAGLGGSVPAPRLSFQAVQWSGFFRGFWLIVAGQALMAVTVLVDQYFSAQAGPGGIAKLGYANRLLSLLLALTATTVTRATLPVFARVAADASADIAEITRRWVCGLFLAATIVVATVWWLAPWVVRVLFQRGAFDAQAATAVTGLFQIGLLQLPFYVAGLVFVSLIASRRRYDLLLLVAGVNLLVKLVVGASAVPSLGVEGVMWSTVCMLAVSFFLLAALSRSVIQPKR